MSQGIHHTNKWLHASVGSLKTFDMVFSNKFLFWFDTFVQTFCVLLAGLLFLVSCAGRYWITFNVTMNMILIMMIIMTQVLPSRCTCCLGSRLPREAARPTDQIGRTSVRHLLATAVKPGIYGLAITMKKWFLTDNDNLFGRPPWNFDSDKMMKKSAL